MVGPFGREVKSKTMKLASNLKNDYPWRWRRSRCCQPRLIDLFSVQIFLQILDLWGLLHSLFLWYYSLLNIEILLIVSCTRTTCDNQKIDNFMNDSAFILLTLCLMMCDGQRCWELEVILLVDEVSSSSVLLGILIRLLFVRDYHHYYHVYLPFLR